MACTLYYLILPSALPCSPVRQGQANIGHSKVDIWNFDGFFLDEVMTVGGVMLMVSGIILLCPVSLCAAVADLHIAEMPRW